MSSQTSFWFFIQPAIWHNFANTKGSIFTRMGCFSLAQAMTIASSSQFLVGHAFDQYHPDTTPILCVTPCPSDERLRERFVEDYDCFGITDLTDYEHAGKFDVIVIARNLPDKEVCLYMPLMSYLQNNKRKLVA